MSEPTARPISTVADLLDEVRSARDLIEQLRQRVKFQSERCDVLADALTNAVRERDALRELLVTHDPNAAEIIDALANGRPIPVEGEPIFPFA